MSEPDPRAAAPSLVRRWESLETGVQAAIAYPTLTVVLTIVHLTVLGQPFWRGVGYGLFWAVPATVLVVMATAHERRKRKRLEAHADGRPDAEAGDG